MAGVAHDSCRGDRAATREQLARPGKRLGLVRRARVSRAKPLIQGRLLAAGVRTDGERPWDIRVHDERFYEKALTRGTLGIGESYVDGWWSCERLDEMTARVFAAGVEPPRPHWLHRLGRDIQDRLLNRQSRRRARRSVASHYDLGEDLYHAMLDPTMTYSCGYWERAETLEQAQQDKHELICRKLGLCSGMHVLDIGCGWGAFAEFAERRRGARVTGITLSEDQAAVARGRVDDIQVRDYRDVSGEFDRIVSIGMFEHVGLTNYRAFFQAARELLAEDGLLLLHTIGINTSTRETDEWTDSYIFPNGKLPSAAQILEASEDLFVLEDGHNFGADYDRTLMAWHRNFSQAWPRLRERYGERFHRLWSYYLLTCAGAFRARRQQLWQIVLSPRGVRGGYRRPGPLAAA